MTLPDLRVTLVQGETHWHDPAANRAMYGELARSAAGNTALLILPETFTSGFRNEAMAAAETMDGPSVAWPGALSVELGAAVTGRVQIRAGAVRKSDVTGKRRSVSVDHGGRRRIKKERRIKQ